MGYLSRCFFSVNAAECVICTDMLGFTLTESVVKIEAYSGITSFWSLESKKDTLLLCNHILLSNLTIWKVIFLKLRDLYTTKPKGGFEFSPQSPAFPILTH